MAQIPTFGLDNSYFSKNTTKATHTVTPPMPTIDFNKPVARTPPAKLAAESAKVQPSTEVEEAKKATKKVKEKAPEPEMKTDGAALVEAPAKEKKALKPVLEAIFATATQPMTLDEIYTKVRREIMTPKPGVKVTLEKWDRVTVIPGEPPMYEMKK